VAGGEVSGEADGVAVLVGEVAVEPGEVAGEVAGVAKQLATDAREAWRMAGMVPWPETSATPSGFSPEQAWKRSTAASVIGPKIPSSVLL
jgi:hypothetical protein